MPPTPPIRIPPVSFGIVGSRKLVGNDYAYRLIDHVLECNHIGRVVSGGAIGIDSMAIELALAHGIDYDIFDPEPKEPGKPAYVKACFARNTKIVDASDALLAIMVRGGSNGTLDSLRKAVRKNIPRVIVEVEL